MACSVRLWQAMSVMRGIMVLPGVGIHDKVMCLLLSRSCMWGGLARARLSSVQATACTDIRAHIKVSAAHMLPPSPRGSRSHEQASCPPIPDPGDSRCVHVHIACFSMSSYMCIFLFHASSLRVCSYRQCVPSNVCAAQRTHYICISDHSARRRGHYHICLLPLSLMPNLIPWAAEPCLLSSPLSTFPRCAEPAPHLTPVLISPCMPVSGPPRSTTYMREQGGGPALPRHGTRCWKCKRRQDMSHIVTLAPSFSPYVCGLDEPLSRYFTGEVWAEAASMT